MVNPPIRVPRGGVHVLVLSFLQFNNPELFPTGTQIVLDLFAPGDLVNPISPGGTVALWARNVSAVDYTASINMAGPLLAALSLTTLYGRLRYTEPGEPEITIDDFHVTPVAGELPQGPDDTIRWEQVENPPEVLTGGAGSGQPQVYDTSEDAVRIYEDAAQIITAWPRLDATGYKASRLDLTTEDGDAELIASGTIPADLTTLF